MADNPNARLEAFCDAVFAIALTLLVLDIRIPPTARIGSAADLWLQLGRLTPGILAFVLSFAVVFITWVNHHATLKLVARPSPSFIYANGLLLLTVAFVPFPTALLGEYAMTSNAAPVVSLYDAVLAAQAVAWILICRTALSSRLARSEHAAEAIGLNGRYGYVALTVYSLLAVAALWLPHAVVAVTVAIWAFWLVRSINMHFEESPD